VLAKDKGSKPKDKEAKAKDTAGFLVRPYLQLPTPTGMTVMWETRSDSPSRVEYGTTRALGSKEEIKKLTYLHEVRLRGLEPETTYYYRVQSGSLASKIYSFKTAPAVGTKRFRMAVYGDSRSNPRVHAKVAGQIARAKVDLIVHTGDIVANGKNHMSWRLEFFNPLGKMARSVPWVSTIGNHERDSENYFSYMALPGNERYFGFDFANAHIICLDSNAWIAKGRDSKQYQWLEEHLKKKRKPAWTFVAFHHPLFSAHAGRPINSLRWDWAPLFLDPANQVDGVLTGHDHFYARNYRMARLADKPVPGVLFLTTGGGAAGLYRCKMRDYVAKEKSVHHFTLLDFNEDRVKVSAIDMNGKTFDEYELTKKATPADKFCAYEIEELRKFLRLALVNLKPVKPVRLGRKGVEKEKAAGTERFHVSATLRVPTRFQVVVSGRLRWQVPAGWKLKTQSFPFRLQPRQALKIPLEADVAGGAFGKAPGLIIEFEADRFRNRFVQLFPFKLAGPDQVRVGRVKGPLVLAPKQLDKAWQSAPRTGLLPLVQEQGQDSSRGDQVQFLADADWLYVRAVLSDLDGKVSVTEPDPCAEGSKLVLFDEHVRVVLADGKTSRTYAVSPESVRYYACNQNEDSSKDWRAVVGKCKEGWCVQFALPRKFYRDLDKVRINVTHRRLLGKAKLGRRYVDLELCPTYRMGSDPDILPDWQTGDGTPGAKVVVD
jgi:hypothetical protein